MWSRAAGRARLAAAAFLLPIATLLLPQGNGNELYLTPLQPFRFVHGMPFGQIWRHFGNALPLGVLRTVADGEPELFLSPPDSFVLSAADSLVLLAQDERDTRPVRSRIKAQLTAPSAIDAPVPTQSSRSKSASKPQRVLIVSWTSRSAQFVQQIDEICPQGSEIIVLSEEGLGATGARNCRVHHVLGDPRDGASFEKVNVGEFSTVVWLPPEQAPAHLLTAMALAHLFNCHGISPPLHCHPLLAAASRLTRVTTRGC